MCKMKLQIISSINPYDTFKSKIKEKKMDKGT